MEDVVPLHPEASQFETMTEQPHVKRSHEVTMQSSYVLVGPENAHVTCPYCLHSVKTSIRHTTTTRTHTLALRCCLLMCCCLPYCMNSAQNTDHYCPGCNKYLGTYKR